MCLQLTAWGLITIQMIYFTKHMFSKHRKNIIGIYDISQLYNETQTYNKRVVLINLHSSSLKMVVLGPAAVVIESNKDTDRRIWHTGDANKTNLPRNRHLIFYNLFKGPHRKSLCLHQAFCMLLLFPHGIHQYTNMTVFTKWTGTDISTIISSYNSQFKNQHQQQNQLL